MLRKKRLVSVAILGLCLVLPVCGNIVTNEDSYPNGEVPRYFKFEASMPFEEGTQNPYLPYDTNSMSGLTAGIGITVDGLFTPDDWQTVYRQPGFYYKDMIYKAIGSGDWYYPSGADVWKVRFAPSEVGTWKYKIVTADANGTTVSPEMTFVCCESERKGFIKVSESDERYFEYDNGEPFLGLGHNLRFGQVNWTNPIQGNRSTFQKLNANGTQLFRTWLSHWSIYGSAWCQWQSPLNSQHAGYPPYVGMSGEYYYPGKDASMKLTWPGSPGRFAGWMTGKYPAVKRNTDYHFSIRYYTHAYVDGPRIAGYPYGLVAKVSSSWLDDKNNNVYKYCDPDSLRTDGKVVTVVTSYGTVTGTWDTVEGTWNTGNRDYMPYIYVVLENVNAVFNGLYIDRIEVREDLGGGEYGPNIIGTSEMAQHLYYDQTKSWCFDKALELAEEYDIYFKLVLHEKNEWIGTHLTYAGYVSDVGSNSNFYGNYRQMTKQRWLQQAWWRYCQGRWGYSPHIHSWELLNEGDPYSGLHYTFTDEFGIYMHQFGNRHPITTSNWHSFPRNEFWANPSYPNVDFADFHIYDNGYTDCAANTRLYSQQYGAKKPGGAGKPLVRGETGFGAEVKADTAGIWMHNYVWGMINDGGMYDHYWDEASEFSVSPDPRRHFRPYRNFMEEVPLNNGNYVDAAASVSGSHIRAWGQKDLVNGDAHLWVQNDQHTWKNIVDGNPMPAVNGTVTIDGFTPGKSHTIEWWDTYESDETAQIISADIVEAGGDGAISFTITDLLTDVGVKIWGYVLAPPTISPAGGGTYVDAVTVTILPADPCETVYYTTDGSQPDDSSIPYTGPFQLSSSAVLKAVSYINSRTSEIVSAVFTIDTSIVNQAPLVSAGSDEEITMPVNTANLYGTVEDGTLPWPPGMVTTTWEKVSGPGTAEFGDAGAVDTPVTFSSHGVYVLRLTAFDGQLSNSDDVTITVNPKPNEAPTVDAGADGAITLPANTFVLNATVNDDGLPDPPAALSTTWSVDSGAGSVVFADAGSVDTSATFSEAGVYVLRLTAGDGELETSDTLYVTVKPEAGSGQTVPGRIEVEYYKQGGEGVGYHDSTGGNSDSASDFTEDVDVGNCPEGGYNLGYIVTGEWTAYDVSVSRSGSYTVTARVATDWAGTRTIRVVMDTADVSGPISFTTVAGGGWSNYFDVTVGGVMLTEGDHEMRIQMESGDFNFNYVDIFLTGDINRDREVDYVDLHNLAEQWLWAGTPGGIGEDLVADGTVNLPDFAVLGANWTVPFISGDINNDGSVDYHDLKRVGDNWLWSGPPAGIPEDISADGSVNLLDFSRIAAEWPG